MHIVTQELTFRTSCGAVFRISPNATNPGQFSLDGHFKRSVSAGERLLQVWSIFRAIP
jgi:hypothetical protein